jgi:hypothetical protein
MLPVTRAAIARMDRSLPDKRRAANPIRQTVPLSEQAEPDRPMTLTASRNRPALGASSNEGGGTQSNRVGWPGWVREGGTLFLIRCHKRRTGDAVGGGRCPRRDRTQISKPQVKSLHKCAYRGASFRPGSQFSRLRLSVCEAGSGPK